MAAESLHGRIVTPGLVLGPVADFSPGSGVYVDQTASCLRAGVAGVTSVGPPRSLAEPQTTPGALDPRLTVSVTRSKRPKHGPQNGATAAKAAMTEALAVNVGDVILGRVTRINFKQASVDVLCVGEKTLPDGFRGTIRSQDVRTTQVDSVEIHRSFAPGDVVRAQVISFGDRFSYFLSTAGNEFGVIHAKGRSGEPMIPISWQEMRDPKTGTREFRKLAKNAGPPTTTGT